MLILCHLFVGTILGLVLSDLLRDRRLVAACMAGAVLPDLIDKPLGHLLLKATIDNGRLFTHSLLLCLLLFLIAGLLIFRRKGPLLMGIGVGVLSHQILDAMWTQPELWYYPLLGQYTKQSYPDFFLHMLLVELTTPTEWLFFAGILICLFSWYRGEWARALAPAPLLRYEWQLRTLILVLIGCAGAAALLAGFMGSYTILTGLTTPLDNLILGSSAVAGAIIGGSIFREKETGVEGWER
jgi:membrane-bound metal-dependent hydrolase YbcI (DUF457 family)